MADISSVPARRCIVHIGLNKTGSTTIQGWLQLNQNALRDQGIWHDSLAPHGGPHLTTAVGWAMYGHANRETYLPRGWQQQAYQIHDRADLLDQLDHFLTRVEASLPPRDAGTYVTSSEHIGAALINPQEIRKLHSWFAERFAEVRYVVYIREQADWLASAYVQAIRSGRGESLDAFIETHGKKDYYQLVRKWADIVGMSNVDVRVFDPARFQGGDLFSDFAMAIGADIHKTTRLPRLNDAMPPYQLWLLRSINRIFRGKLDNTPLVKLQRRLFSKNMPPLFGATKIRLSPDQTDRVRALNADSNEALRALVFPAEQCLFPAASAHQSPRSAQGVAAAFPQVTGQ